MRRHGDLFERVTSVENLWRAWRTFRSGKRGRPDVLAFEPEADRHVVDLHRRLAQGTYRPQGYRLLRLHEPKRRLIASAPVLDRVVHHAVHRVLAPLLDPTLLPSVYACLPGRGSHRAVLACVAALRRYDFVLCLDVRHYFLSIDHAVLLELMERRIKDARLLALLATLIESGVGLYMAPGVPQFLGLEPGFPGPRCGVPIGNLTSQWWGNHYLSGLDHFIKRELKVPHYQRYMDDLTLLSDSRASLEAARTAIGDWLLRQRRLRLKHPHAAVRSTQLGFTYLGHRVTRAGAGPTRAVLQRMQQRVGERVLRGDREGIERSIASYQGLLGVGRLTTSVDSSDSLVDTGDRSVALG
jgi:RNA-directed DNA polymerase